MEKDPLLEQVVETPFYFNTLQLLFAGSKNLSDLCFDSETRAGREAEIVERFVENELRLSHNSKYTADQAKHWLAFLADRMQRANLVVFELSDLQYDWWEWKSLEKILIVFISSLVVVFVFGFIFGLAYMSITVFLGWFAFGLFFLFYSIFINNELAPKGKRSAP